MRIPPLFWSFDLPVQKPGHFGAGHGRPKPGSFRCQSGRLEHSPGKVPLLRAAKGDGVAVNCTLQVGVDPAPRQRKYTLS